LRIARGIQNKVLEAMSMAKTIVVSPQALEGIEAQPGQSLLLALDAGEYADAVKGALERPDAAIGSRARSTVEQRYGWASNLAHVKTLLEAAGHASH
jgi:glycosyltransferase involved in cell wall biosynthesis